MLLWERIVPVSGPLPQFASAADSRPGSDEEWYSYKTPEWASGSSEIDQRCNRLKNYVGALLCCSLALPGAFAADPGALEMQDVWVRALPPGQTNTAGYATVINNGDAPVILVGGRSEIADQVEIHTTREVDGLRRMEQLAEVVIPAGQSVTFAPGGMHLMLLGLERMPSEGEKVLLCLSLKSTEELCASADVFKSRGAAHSHEHH